MRKNLLPVLALFMGLSFYSCSDVDLYKEANVHDELSESALVQGAILDADASSQWEANEKLSRLINTFGTMKNRINKEMPRFPDYYGGAYITEKGNLVVYIYGDMEKGRQNVISLIGSNNLEFKEAEYSFAYLTDIMDQLNEFVINKKNPQAMENFNFFAVMDMENRVVVELNDYSDAKIEEFKKSVFNSPAITFRKSEGPLVLHADLNPGCETSGDIYAGSFGFRARRISDGKVGMVTSGHVISFGETAYFGSTTTPIGVCSASQIAGSIDAAFIVVTNPAAYVPTNLLCGTSSDLLSVSTSNPGAGTTVNKRGKTSGHTTGTIINTNATWTAPQNGNVLTNITSANYSAAGGDSGGTVYTYISATGTRPTVGAHLGATVSGTTTFYVKADQILSAFGLQRY